LRFWRKHTCCSDVDAQQLKVQGRFFRQIFKGGSWIFIYKFFKLVAPMSSSLLFQFQPAYYFNWLNIFIILLCTNVFYVVNVIYIKHVLFNQKGCLHKQCLLHVCYLLHLKLTYNLSYSQHHIELPEIRRPWIIMQVNIFLSFRNVFF
jgi:hypothetical protein